MNEQENNSLDFLKNLPIPDLIKQNAITALSKGISKLITSVTDIPVAHLEGKAKLIRARADVEVKLIEAAANAAAELFKTDNELANRALYNFGRRIIEGQVNKDKIAFKTVHQLNSTYIEKDAKESIDNDWITIFWNLSETKSAEDVQEILAKILSKEIIKPRSVSPNTLQLLSVLTSDLGNSFSRLCNLSIEDDSTCFVIHPHVFSFQNIGPLNEYDVSYNDLFELDGAGLIRNAETIMFNYDADPDSTFEKVNYAGIPAELKVAGKQLRLIQFTKSGKELRNLISLKENKKYTAILLEHYGDAFRIIKE
ncbi:MAG: DUF2806 domain-containing protein [Bacteroidales bacterium]